MSYTNGTTHYNLPLTTGNDKRDWSDTNQAFTDVDAALYSAVQDTAQSEVDIAALEARMDTAEQNIGTNTTDIAGLDTRLTTAEGNITSQSTQIADVRSDGEDMICAYNEASATSTHAYSIGDYFIYNDVLYRVTASISVGDTIVPDINCTTTNVTTEIATAGDNAVDMICTVTENTTTATRNYTVGDYFILNDVLYRVTATITVGTTIIPGTNCTSTTVTSELMNTSAIGSSWHSITFTGDYDIGDITGRYNDVLKIAIVSVYAHDNIVGNFTYTMNVVSKKHMYSAAQNTGYIEVGENSNQIHCNAIQQNVFGEIVFDIV